MKLSCNTRRSLSISFEWLYLFSDTSTSMPQWGSVRAVWFILLTMVITRPMKLEKVPVNSKITASWWTNISPKQYSCILNLTNMKNEELLDSKRDCVSWLSSHFFYYSQLHVLVWFAMELEKENDKTTASSQTKFVSQAWVISNVTNN